MIQRSEPNCDHFPGLWSCETGGFDMLLFGLMVSPFWSTLAVKTDREQVLLALCKCGLGLHPAEACISSRLPCYPS